ncbi:Leukotoxin [Nymphon striatum]|nr:Leukotoxin [Nymphon striatum]
MEPIMTVVVDFPQSGAFRLQNFADIVDFVFFHANYTSRTSTTVLGNGTLFGERIFVEVVGTGFSAANERAGTVDSLSVTSNGETLSLFQLDLTMAEILDAVDADNNRTDVAAVENLMLNLDYEFNLGDAADIVPRNARSEDGVLLNLRGDDVFNAGGGNDSLFAGDGTDTMIGGSGNDTLDGGAGNDRLVGGSGSDDLIGSSGRDRLFGNGGRDELEGGSGADRLSGGGGRDTLDGGSGRDRLTGGSGNDVFVFNNRSGRDTITDFNANSNREDIDLSDVSRIRNFRDLSRNHLEQDGDDVLISAGRVEIRLLDTDIDDLGRGDFLF